MNEDLADKAQHAIREAESILAAPQAPAGDTLLEALQKLSEAVSTLHAHTRDIEHRLAAQQALLDDRLLRVETNRLFTLWSRIRAAAGRAWVVRRLVSRPAESDRLAADRDYTVWVGHEQSMMPPAQCTGAAYASARPKISAIMATSNPALLGTTIRSLCSQVYDNWELCLALNSETQSCLSDFTHLGGRVRWCPALDAAPAAALNAAAELASGDFLCFPAEGDTLSRFALHCVAATREHGKVDVIYTDEDRVDAAGRRFSPLFKPNWSPDLLACCMYMGQLLVVRRDAFFRANGFSADSGAAYLHDFALRLASLNARFCHVPGVLYHARKDAPLLPATAQIQDDASTPAPIPLTAIICSRSPRQLRTCLEALRKTASAVITRTIVVMHEERGPDEVLRQVVREAGAEAISFTGVFNFSEMNNSAASLVHTPGILFLNDDVVAADFGWAEMLAGKIAVERVGIAGSLLRYPAGDIQHAGIALGIGEGAGHIGRHARSAHLWPWLDKTRNVSAVTGACLAIRTELFESLGRFDAGFPNNFNDVDLCLRARERGYDVVCVSAPGLIHSECGTRRGIVRFEERYRFYAKWAHALARPDPYYSESLAATEGISLNLEGWRGFRALLAPTREW